MRNLHQLGISPTWHLIVPNTSIINLSSLNSLYKLATGANLNGRQGNVCHYRRDREYHKEVLRAALYTAWGRPEHRPD